MANSLTRALDAVNRYYESWNYRMVAIAASTRPCMAARGRVGAVEDDFLIFAVLEVAE